MLPVTAIVVTIAILLVFKLLQPEPPIKKNEEKSWVVQTHQLVGGAKSPQLELYGQVESPYTTIITAAISADVSVLIANEGERVMKGQRLLKLDEVDVQLALQQRTSDVAELEAQISSEKSRYQNDLEALKLEQSLVSLAEKKLAREEKTSKANLTSQSSYDTQKQALQSQKLALKARQLAVADHPARLAQLEARLAQKRAQLQQAETDLSRATISAPFEGIILSTNVSPGERVRPGEELLKLYSTENLELRAQLPQRFIATIQQALQQHGGLTATARVNNKNLSLTLSRISGTLAQTGVGVDALFEVAAKDAGAFIMGDVLEIILTLPPINNVYSVPVSALYGTDRIYKVENSRLSAVKVEKMGGKIKQGRQYLLVQSDKLKAGDEVITTQLPHAVSGMKVEIRNRTSAEQKTATSDDSRAAQLQ